MNAIIKKFGITSAVSVLGLLLSAAAIAANQSLFIRASGQTHLTSQVVSNTNSTLLVQSFLGTWTVNTSDTTGLNVASLSDVQLGDTVSVIGTLGSGMSINAKTITDITANAHRNSETNHVSGTISSVNDTAGSFTLTKKNGKSLNVTANANTQVFVNGSLSAFNRLSNGSTATVSGTFNETTNTLAASSIISPMITAKDDNENTEVTGKDNAKIHVEMNHALNSHANAFGLLKISDDENGND